jgi:hypothetical protein
MRFPILAATLLLAGTSPALAHRLHSDVKLTADQLRVEAYYADDTPAQEAKVTVVRGDEVIAQGRTDEKGVWNCPRPEPGSYTVRVLSAGHAADPATIVVPDSEAAPVADPGTDDRESRTRSPWAGLGVGLGVIAGLGVAWMVARRALTRASGGA